MASIIVYVTFTFAVAPDETLPQPRAVTDAMDRAVRALEVKEKPGVALSLVAVS